MKRLVFIVEGDTEIILVQNNLIIEKGDNYSHSALVFISLTLLKLEDYGHHHSHAHRRTPLFSGLDHQPGIFVI